MKIVTSILNPDQEKLITSLLFSQGCEITFRALSINSLIKFLANQLESVVVVYSTEFFAHSDLKKVIGINSKHRFIEVNPEPFSPIKLLSDLSNIEVNYKTYSLERLNNVYAVMGTYGSPGVSTLSNFLAEYVSGIILAASHHNLRPKSNTRVVITSPENLGESVKSVIGNRIIIDSGAAINLTSTLVDRRLNSRWLKEVIGTANQLLYIIKSDNSGISYLDSFVSDFKNLINPPDITYILNQQKFDRISQENQNRFRSLISGSRNFILPYTNRVTLARPLKRSESSIWRTNSFQKQIAKIGAQLL
ncbi:MAG: hypothetical protein RLY62_155 [Actinomycetota bacterium]|jgi:hypothetical protein|nr:hypothetical protein [Actinomycetota bacterium]